MNFKERVAAVLQKLGLVRKAAEKTMTAEEIASVASTYLAEYGVELAADAAKEKEAAEKAAAFDIIKNAIAMASETGNDPENDPKEDSNPETVAHNIVSRVTTLEKNVQDMAVQTRKDTPVSTVNVEISISGRAHTATHFMGLEHDLFSLKKHYNQVARLGRVVEDASDDDVQAFFSDFKSHANKVAARYKELYKLGAITVGKLGEIDYSGLAEAGLGEQFIVRRMDALISRIVMLPSLDGIFPRRSNIQDGEVLTNAFFGDFSQAYQAGEISKGSASFSPEVARVDDAMFKFRIESFKWIERQYIGYLNTSGSDPIKWNMIEWLILNISQKLQSERNFRVINGCRIEPKANTNGHFNFAATGLVHRLISYVEGNKVLPFTESELNDYTSATIGDVFGEFVEKVAAILPNISDFVLYANKQHQPWFKAWYNAKYGGNADYTGVKNTVPNYDVNIVWLPNMGNMKLIFMAQPGNILQLENVPGEMNKITFEQRLESVWAYSVWKEGVSATFAGKKFESKAELEASGRSEQLIFMNMPSKAVAADATVLAAADGPFYTTGANTKATAITDITGAKEGVVYIITCGVKANASTIAKSGNFSEISAAWTPTAVGDYLKVYFDGTKFQEVSRKVSA